MSIKNYWVVGASFSNEDVSQLFLDQKVWYDGYAENDDWRYKPILDKIKSGDVLLMKSSSTKGSNHSLTFTKLKFIGIVIGKEKDHRFKMNWLNIPELPKDFDGISYRTTIENVRDDELLKYAKSIIERYDMKDILSILKFKHQIILQGPPGTGKTRLAKMMAEDLCKSKTNLTPIQYIDNYIQNYVETENSKEKKQQRHNLVELFQERFPKEDLINLTLDSYCMGSGTKDSFCYWLEQKLEPLGKFSPGKSGNQVYLIYLSKNSKYEINKLNEPAENAIVKVAKVISNLVNHNDISEAKKLFHNGLILKILNSYFSEEYFPVYNHGHIRIVGNLFDIEIQKLDEIEINQKINDKFKNIKAQYSSPITNYELMEHLYDKFKLKQGQVNLEESKEIKYTGEYKIIQFHPSYSYEDFVRGITVKTNEQNQIEYKVENRIFAEFAEKALNNASGKYVLIIDEINRANLPSVLGELIYALEYRYKEEDPKGTTVESMYALDTETESNRELKLPDNLYIIGTMNTADRSVGHIDYAIRRRFAFVDVLPDKNIIDSHIAKELFEKVRLIFTNYLAADFDIDAVMLGHSYFLTNNNSKELRLKLKYEVLPILNEYLKDGVLEKNDDSIKAIKELANSIDDINE
jgi:DNA polymerase III delta prime subunit